MILIFLKVLGDICLCYGVMGAFPTLFTHSFPFLYPAVVCAGGAAAASALSYLRKDWPRFLALILPASTLLLCGGIMDFVVLLPAIAYSAVVICKGEFSLEYYTFRTQFRRGLITLVGFFLFVLVFYFFEVSTNQAEFIIHYEDTLKYGMGFALTGVLLQRKLRIGADADGKPLTPMKAIAVFGGISVFLIGILAAERLLRESASSLLKLLTDTFALIVGVMGWLAGLIFAMENQNIQDQLQTQQTTTPLTSPFQPPTYAGGGETAPPPEPAGFPWWLVAAIVLILLGTLLYFLQAYRLRSSGNASSEERSKVAGEKKEKTANRRSNRNKVRHYYRQFLRAQRKKGLKRRIDQTSADILQSLPKDTDLQAATKLREIYLVARYDMNAKITQQQVDEAKAALQKTRGG